MFTEDFSGVVVCDGDGVAVDQDEDRFFGVCFVHAEVMHFACTPERDFTVVINVVVSDAPRVCD